MSDGVTGNTSDFGSEESRFEPWSDNRWTEVDLRGQKSPLLLEASSMIEEQDIKKLIDDHLEGSDLFLVELQVKAGNNILVFIDGDHDVHLQDCIDLSRHIESNLDRDEEDFSLNVSSHGLDQPLRMFRQYPKNVGRVLNIVLEDGTRKKGKLLKADKEGLTIMPSPLKKKKKTNKDITEDYISFDQIKETKVVATFKKQ